MKKFNINDHIYIQITAKGWEHLKKTVGDDYINHCINRDPYRKEINGEAWFRLQAHEVFSLLPINFGGRPLYNTNVMFDEEELR